MAKLVTHRKRCGHCETGELMYFLTDINTQVPVHKCNACGTTDPTLQDHYPFDEVIYDEKYDVFD